MRSNQGTCVNQRPIVTLNQRVEKGDVIADGPATDHGEISLGKNALVGFMTWEGYNYEDAVLINEKMVATMSTPRFISRNTRSKREIQSSDPRRSQGTSRTSPTIF